MQQLEWHIQVIATSHNDCSVEEGFSKNQALRLAFLQRLVFCRN
jgi:hypothetical protein